MLGRLRMSVEDAINCYETLAVNVFSEVKDGGGLKKSATLLENTIKEIVKRKTGDSEARLLDDGILGGICNTFVCAVNAHNMNARQPVLFRTYTSPKEPPIPCAIWQAARATSAAPKFFERIHIGPPIRQETYVDGGLGRNNPTDVVLQEAGVMFPHRSIACIISIGTGKTDIIAIESPSLFKRNETIKALASILRDCEETAQDMQRKFENHPKTYFRFNVEQGLQTIEPWDRDRMSMISAHTRSYMQMHEIDSRLSTAVQVIRAVRGVIDTRETNSIQVRNRHPTGDGRGDLDMRFIEQKLQPAIKAPYKTVLEEDHLQRHECTPNTRVKILQGITEWANQASPDSPRVFWLTGQAGSGKTTIAYTIAKQFDEGALPGTTVLGANFFCSRDFQETQTKTRIIPTIAYQLARKCTPYATALDDDAFQAVNHRVSDQIKAILGRPWQQSMGAYHSEDSHYLIVIDALDELKDEGGLEFLRELLAAICKNDCRGLKFLITVRSHHELNDLLNSFTPRKIVYLQDVPIDEAKEDVKIYLNSSLLELTAYSALQNLVEQSGGLFIYAATVVRYLTRHRSYTVLEKIGMLREILNKAYDPTSAKKATNRVDKLYRWIMLKTFSRLTEECFTRRLCILHTFLFAAERVSPSIAAALIPGADEDSANGVLRDLHSVLYIADGRVFWYHASFPDFISDQVRSTFPLSHNTWVFSYNPPAHNKVLTASCFRIMGSSLKRNICLLDETDLTDEVPDFEQKVMSHISAPLQYASRFWASHLVRSYLDEDVLDSLKAFCKQHLLHWIEILSLLRELKMAGEALSSVQRVLSCLHDPPQAIQHLLSECGQIIREFFPALHMSWSQIYLSAIPFSPLGSHLRGTYNQIQSPIIIQGLQGTWGTTLSIMKSPGWHISSVLFSPDGQRIVSSSNKSIILWDSQTGAQLATLAGIDASFERQMAFSTDGRILYTSDGPQVQCLDAGNGDLMSTLEAESPVKCLALSSTEDLLAAGLGNGNVIAWNVYSGGKVVILPSDYVDRNMGFANPAITCLTFSKSGTFLVWGSLIGCTIWRVNDWSIYRNFPEPTYPYSVDISVDDRIVACGSTDTAIIWDMQGDAQRPLLTVKAEYSQVKFWPLNKDIVTILSKGTFELWDTLNRRTVASEQTLLSYLGTPFSFSPDGRYFVTAEPSDNSVHVLKVPDLLYGSDPPVAPFPIALMEEGIPIQPAVCQIHQGELSCVALSPDGSVLAIAANDSFISLWGSGTFNSGPKHTLEVHDGIVSWVAFSRSGKQIVSSGDHDDPIRVWDAEDGICMYVLSNMPQFRFTCKSMFCRGDRSIVFWDRYGLYQWTYLYSQSVSTVDEKCSDLLDTVAVSLDGKLISVANGRCIFIVDVNVGETKMTLSIASNKESSVISDEASDFTDIDNEALYYPIHFSFSDDSTRLLSAGKEGTIYLWDITNDDQKNP
ncbi:hypothetical protein H0H87_010418, partial [Tephrocybe sp. NHM501043]